MTVKLNLIVNDTVIRTDYFVEGFVDHVVSGMIDQVQTDITRVCNRIRRMLEFHGLDEGLPAGNWSPAGYTHLREKLSQMQISDSLQFSFRVMFRELENLHPTPEGACPATEETRQ
jgi:hypothetical protein